jgi:hypothetical protein
MSVGGTLRAVLPGTASALVAAAAASGAIYLVLAVNEYRIPFLQLWAVSTAILLIGSGLHRVPRPEPEREPAAAAAAADPHVRPFSAADWWMQRLDATSGDVEWFDRVVRSRLVALVTERMRQHHGVLLAGDPPRVREIMGTELYEFLTAPLPRTPTPAELEWLLSRMEEI